MDDKLLTEETFMLAETATMDWQGRPILVGIHVNAPVAQWAPHQEVPVLPSLGFLWIFLRNESDFNGSFTLKIEGDVTSPIELKMNPIEVKSPSMAKTPRMVMVGTVHGLPMRETGKLRITLTDGITVFANREIDIEIASREGQELQ